MNKKICLLVSLIILFTLPLLANNISIDGNVTLTDQSTVGAQSTHYTHIKFDISWENSWRLDGVAAPNNWDAAWVFAKYNIVGDDPDLGCQYCTLNTSGHTAPTGSVVENPTSDNPQTGVFIYRSETNKTTEGNAASVDWNNAKLRWNYGTDVADDATVDVKVFAIEMVYIPQGSFSLYNGESTDLNSNFNSGNTIDSEDETEVELGTITWAMESDWCGAQTSDGVTGGSADLCGGYPKGFEASYCMKYEISQGQWVDFLNTLTRTEQNSRTGSDVSTDDITNVYVMSNTSSISYRCDITCPGTGNGTTNPITFTASVPNRACNYLQWADGLAYADWAGLRPMTELEFEKICRGSESADTDYAWGSTTISGLETGTGTRYQENNGYDAASSSIDDNCHYNNSGSWSTGGGPYGPVRCGSFATNLTTRQQSGASYYGVMEMSGNLWERCITVAKYCYGGDPLTWNNETDAGSFDGQHGDGTLTGTGFADVTNWPSPAVTSGYTALGTSYRGATWNDPATQCRVSDRSSAAYTGAIRMRHFGFRAVRTL